MRKRAGIFLGVTIAIAGIAISIAQEKSAEAKTSGSTSLTNGMLVVAELSSGLNTKHAKAGDIIKARVAQDVIAEGRIVVPRDSKMLGRVIKVKTSNKEDRESRLEVIFDRVRLKHGGAADFRGVIQAVAAPITHIVDHSDQILPPGFVSNNRPIGSAQSMGGAAKGTGLGTSSRTGALSAGTGTSGPANVPIPDSPKVRQVSPAGGLSVGARGVIGIPDLVLRADAADGTVKTVLRSRKGNIYLDDGTQMVVRVIPDVQSQPHTGNPDKQ